MEYFYMVCFWVFFVSLIPALIFKQEALLPLAAIVFTIGGLWHKKEDQKFEKQKYTNEVKLAFRQIRWGYYSLLRMVVRDICSEWSYEDLLGDRENKYRELLVHISDLEDEAVVLFGDSNAIGGYVRIIRESFAAKTRILRAIHCGKYSTEKLKSGTDEQVMSLSKSKLSELDRRVKNAFVNCKNEIFPLIGPVGAKNDSVVYINKEPAPQKPDEIEKGMSVISSPTMPKPENPNK